MDVISQIQDGVCEESMMLFSRDMTLSSALADVLENSFGRTLFTLTDLLSYFKCFSSYEEFVPSLAQELEKAQGNRVNIRDT